MITKSKPNQVDCLGTDDVWNPDLETLGPILVDL